MSDELQTKLAYLTAQVQALQKELDRLRHDSTKDTEHSRTRAKEFAQEADNARKELEKEVATLQGEVSHHRRLVTGVRAVLYVLALILTFRLGDIKVLF